MKAFLTAHRLWLLAFALILLSNAAVLLGVQANASGKPTSVPLLSERELSLPYGTSSRDNSGLSLRINWHTLSRDANSTNRYYDYRSPAWLDADKLESLGFDLQARLKSRKKPVSKELFIVLEFEGNAYQEALRRAQYAYDNAEAHYQLRTQNNMLAQNNYQSTKDRLEQLRTIESRLYAIDAGNDPKQLREHYSDRAKFIIVKGVIRPDYGYIHTKEKLFGHISRLSINRVHVPLKYRKLFDAISEQNKLQRGERVPPRYELKLAYGSRYEPYIDSVMLIRPIFN